MYDYVYENEVLLALRIFKYLQVYEPGVFQAMLKELGSVDFDALYDNVFFVLEEVFDSPYTEPELEEDYCYGMLCLEHRTLDEFLALSLQYCDLTGESPVVFRKKLQDIILFHVCDITESVYDIEFRYDDMGLLRVPIWFAESFDVMAFSSGLIDLAMYIQAENKRLQAQISALQSETETIWREAA